jgi:hypothetical protein
LRKLAGVPKQTGKSICARGWTRFPGATPWNGDTLGHSLSKPVPMSSRECAYKMLRLLPPSMSTLENRVLPDWDVVGMMVTAEGDRVLRPVKIGWCSLGDGEDLLALLLALPSGHVCCRFAEDEEHVLD